MKSKLIFYITLIFLSLLFCGCLKNYPDALLVGKDFCRLPEEFTYTKTDNPAFDQMVIDKINTWSPELRSYFKNKISDRIIILKKCESKIEEWEIYNECER